MIKINNTAYNATVTGLVADAMWNFRESKTIHILDQMDYATAASLFTDGAAWTIVDVFPATETTEAHTYEFDNSDYSIVGDITAHKDGTVSIKMGMPTQAELTMTALEDVLEKTLGGDNE